MNTAKVTHRGLDYEMIDFPSGYREHVFADLWEEYNRPTNGVLETIFTNNNLGKMTQQDATLAATLVQWLGTNVGSRFLDRVKVAMVKGLSLAQTFLDHWTKENASVITGCKHGLLAALLVSTEKLSGLMYPGYDPISERDIQVANALMAWLANKEGQLFLNQANQRLINIIL